MSNGFNLYLWGFIALVLLILSDFLSNQVNVMGNGIISLNNKFKFNERTKKKDVSNSENQQ
jgi:hypothetical protein